MITLTETQLGLGALGLFAWIARNFYMGIIRRIERLESETVNKDCHNQCTSEKEKMNELLLTEIRGLRDDFKDKSTIVIDAVKKR
jgi:hypothetical protein